MKATMLLTT